MAKKKKQKPQKPKNQRQSKAPKSTAAPATAPPLANAWPDSAAVPIKNRCHNCGGEHTGDSEESLMALDPEAAVFYDRDVADTNLIAGLCGPRFRMSGRRLHAHYGTPARTYKVFEWSDTKKSWTMIIDAEGGARVLRASL